MIIFGVGDLHRWLIGHGVTCRDDSIRAGGTNSRVTSSQQIVVLQVVSCTLGPTSVFIFVPRPI